MKRIQSIIFLLAISMLPQTSLAAVLGPRVELPLEWVWARGYGGNFYQATAARGFAAASNGTDFLIAWMQYTRYGVDGPNGEAPWNTSPGVFAVRMDSSGAILDGSPLLLGPAVASETYVGAGEWLAYAQASDSYLAAWRCENGIEACLVRLSSAGMLLDAAPVRVPATVRPIVASDGVRHFVLAGDHMYVVAADGGWAAFPIGFAPGAVASDGTNLLNVKGGAITLFAPDGAALAAASMPPGIGGRSVTFDGSAYVILGYGFTAEGEGEYVTRVDTSGSVIDTSLRLRFGVADNFFDISYDGLNDIAVWCPTPPAYDGGPVTIAVFESGAVVGADILTTGKVLMWLSVASNAIGTSTVVVDDFAYGESFNSFHPTVQLVTSWAPVTVSKNGSGRGAVVSAPAGIDCGATCMGRFDVPGALTLTATAEPGSAFGGWGGDCAGSDAVCTVALDATKSVVATFEDVAAPVLTVPETIHAVATRSAGAIVGYAVSARDNISADLNAVCTPASGTLFPPGTTRVECTASDAAGNVATASFDIAVAFAWSGVLRPISVDGSSVFKLERTIPVKFQLTGASAGIADLLATLSLSRVSDGVQGTPDETLWTNSADGGNVFRFDPAGGIYIFNLGTNGLSPGTWVVSIDLGDGVGRTASFVLRT